ncbi:MAG: tRNA pseudouridine(38-40) synthase TruA [Bacteroidales bacterium]|nr:tRNA pseudouridine(38-40) synthase TruA [Bacteroidales bacterium]
MRYFIEISFDGSNYHGWQKQNNGISVQAVLELKLSLQLRENIELVGCGRTDAGVHARQFFAHFDVNIQLDLKQTVFKLNRFLPSNIAVIGLYKVQSYAHARFSAIERTYKYYIQTVKNPFNTKFVWDFTLFLDMELMNKACDILMKTTDFTSFSKLHGGQKNNLCQLYYCKWERNEQQLIFTIAANRFTRNMVRAIVGTMVEIGKGKLGLSEFENIIASKNRCLAGESVFAGGLFLDSVLYPSEIFIDSFRLY